VFSGLNEILELEVSATPSCAMAKKCVVIQKIEFSFIQLICFKFDCLHLFLSMLHRQIGLWVETGLTDIRLLLLFQIEYGFVKRACSGNGAYHNQCFKGLLSGCMV
jgi:hypothetical protein